MKKIICWIVGHKVNVLSCPVTHAKSYECSRCGLGSSSRHGSEISFK